MIFKHYLKPFLSMRIVFLTFLVVCGMCSNSLFAQTLYTASYGDKSHPAVIYVHGGPRGNATLFEGTIAQHLADQGMYVIVYDRRGEGRSSDPQATLTFQEAFRDLHAIAKQYNVEKFSLIGHSFGGLVSTLYTEAFPEKVSKLILVGGLFAQQETYNHILDSCTILAKQTQDSATLKKIADIQTLDHLSADYRKKTYEIAAKAGFFSMPHPTAESIARRKEYEASEFGKNNIRNDEAPYLFYKNERQVNIDTKAKLQKIKQSGVHLAGIYGLQDGIFSPKQLLDIQHIIGLSSFFTIDNCSHYPFVDQQQAFTEALIQILQVN